VLKETQSSQIELKTAIKDQMIRQVKTVDPLLSQEKVEEIVSDPEVLNKDIHG